MTLRILWNRAHPPGGARAHAAPADTVDATIEEGVRLRTEGKNAEANQERGQRDGDFFIEAFAVFVQIWLAHTPRLADADKPSAEQSALQRFREYAEHVAEKVAEGRTFLADRVRENVAEGDRVAPEPSAKPRGGSR